MLLALNVNNINQLARESFPGFGEKRFFAKGKQCGCVVIFSRDFVNENLGLLD